jgi:hypothetical protein
VRFYRSCFRGAVVNPVGALTSKPYAFKVRPWELKDYEIFDPTAEFYMPVLVNVLNNVIHRVLPAPNHGIHETYGWISNRLRFFGESLAAGSLPGANVPKDTLFSVQRQRTWSCRYSIQSRSIERSWTFSIHRFACRLVYQRSDIYLANSYLGVSKQNLFADFEYSNLWAQSLTGSRSSIDNMYWVNSFEDFSDVRVLSRAELIRPDRSYSKVFLISFSPYFTDPTLNHCLRKFVDLHASNFYTIMFPCATVNPGRRNMFPTAVNLNLLFSGKHIWSNYMNHSSSLLIIDVLFFRTLPVELARVIVRFLSYCSVQIHLVNVSSLYKFSDSGVGIDSINQSNQQFLNPILMGCDVQPVRPKNFKTQNIIESFFLLGQDHMRILNPVVAHFSQSTGFIDRICGCSEFWFPTLPFPSVSTSYKSPFSSNSYRLNRVLASTGGRPIGQIFYSIGVSVYIVRRYVHANLQRWLWVFLVLFVLYQYTISGYLPIFVSIVLIHAGTRPSTNYIVPFNWDVFGKFRSHCLISINNNLYKERIVGCRHISKLIGLDQFHPYYYSSSDPVPAYDPHVMSSKTLALERIFRISRFTNFGRKIDTDVRILCKFLVVDCVLGIRKIYV